MINLWDGVYNPSRAALNSGQHTGLEYAICECANTYYSITKCNTNVLLRAYISHLRRVFTHVLLLLLVYVFAYLFTYLIM